MQVCAWFRVPYIINPRHMREGYSSRFVCECVCVSDTALPAIDAISMSQTRCCKVPYRISIVCIVPKNTPFKRSGVICRSPPPSSLPDELLMNTRDSNGFFLEGYVWLEIDQPAHL
jgi:hypothetical protein